MEPLYYAKSSLISLLSARGEISPNPDWNYGKGAGWIRRVAWYRFPRPFFIRWVLGIKLEVSGPDEALREIFFHGQYEPTEFHYVNDVLKPGMIFIDIGANIGLYSIFASKKVGRSGKVIAIEPSRREYNKLHRNVVINRANNVYTVKRAVSDSNGSAQLQVADEHFSGHNSIGSFIHPTTKVVGVETVPTETLDDLIGHLPAVNLIKIDAEGSELAILRGAVNTLSRHHPILLIEVSNTLVSDFLQTFGYTSQPLGSLTLFR